MLNLALVPHSALGNPPLRNQLRPAIESIPIMRLFKSDLYRNFAIGFVVGAAIVGAQAGPELWTEIVPQAQAQTVAMAGAE